MNAFFILLSVIFTTHGQVYSQPKVIPINLQVVSDSAATGDGGNAWGGHQCRIVRTKEGVFTAYTVAVAGAGGIWDVKFYREWRLVKRTESGWKVIASGLSGKDPVNLMASPDGILYIVAWPGGNGTMWSCQLDGDTLAISKDQIPGVVKGNWPYNSAGIDSMGNICVLSSEGGSEPGGSFLWSYLPAQQRQWINQTTQLDYRYCYTYVFPHRDGSLSLVSTRDVLWEALGYQQPPGAFDYVFNAFRYWQTNDVNTPLQEMAYIEEPPTPEFPFVSCNAQIDAYIDTKQNMHILYGVYGASTSGNWQRRHVVFSQQGDLLHNGEISLSAGWFCRIFQDVNERYFILGDAGFVYLLADDGYTPVDSVQFDLQGLKVEYSGFGVSVPRTGTPLSNTMEVVFPTNEGKAWIYFSLALDELFPLPLVVPDHQTIINRFELFQNYPNPFNAETIIRYKLAGQSDVMIKIYNASGQQITALVNSVQQAGEYSVRWKGKDDHGQPVATGVYLVRLKAGDFTGMRKMLFIR
jgi:hypothetical protein